MDETKLASISFCNDANTYILTIPLVFLVASGEIDLSFASTYAVAAYVFAILVKAGFDPALCILAGLFTGTAIGGLVGALIVVFRLSSLVASLGVLFLLRGYYSSIN